MVCTVYGCANLHSLESFVKIHSFQLCLCRTTASHACRVIEHADLSLWVVALGVFVAHTVVGLEAAHGNLCVP